MPVLSIVEGDTGFQRLAQQTGRHVTLNHGLTDRLEQHEAHPAALDLLIQPHVVQIGIHSKSRWHHGKIGTQEQAADTRKSCCAE